MILHREFVSGGAVEEKDGRVYEKKSVQARSSLSNRMQMALMPPPRISVAKLVVMTSLITLGFLVISDMGMSSFHMIK